jgi:hypothetical protein
MNILSVGEQLLSFQSILTERLRADHASCLDQVDFLVPIDLATFRAHFRRYSSISSDSEGAFLRCLTRGKKAKAPGSHGRIRHEALTQQTG